jgi:hypothetical protein
MRAHASFMGVSGAARIGTRVAASALVALCSAPMLVAQSATGTITGVVYDSVAARPLARATVQLVRPEDPASTRTISTDSAGRFVLDGIAPGRWLIGAQHARLDTLGVEQLAHAIDVKARGVTRTTLAIPSTRTLVAKVCGSTVAHDSSGYVHGTIRRVDAARGAVSATVRVQWLDLVLMKGGLQRRVSGFDVESNAAGAYIACGVPIGAMVRVRAWSGADSTGVLDVALTTQGIDQRDLLVGASRQVTQSMPVTSSSPTDSAVSLRVTVLRGDGMLRGVVRGPGEQPLSNVRVSLRGTGQDLSTGNDGAFTLRDLPLGTHTLDVRAIGFQPFVNAVDIVPDAAPSLTVRLERLVSLDTVRVRALRNRAMGPDMVEFDQRRRTLMGRFMDAEDIEKLNPIFVTDIFRNIQGMSVTPSPAGDLLTMLEGSDSCTPSLYVNGALVLGDNVIDSFLSLREVRAVEVYTTAARTPPQFLRSAMIGGADDGKIESCGAVVIWTGSRSLVPRKER